VVHKGEGGGEESRAKMTASFFRNGSKWQKEGKKKSSGEGHLKEEGKTPIFKLKRERWAEARVYVLEWGRNG